MGASAEGLSSLFTELPSPGPHWPHPTLALGRPFLGCHLKGPSGETWRRSLVWRFVILAFSFSSQHPDRHRPSLCLGGHPVWACRLLQRAALPTLETVHKFRLPEFVNCLPWRQFTNSGSLPRVFAWLFSCVDYPDAPNLGSMCFCTDSGTQCSPSPF